MITEQHQHIADATWKWLCASGWIRTRPEHTGRVGSEYGHGPPGMQNAIDEALQDMPPGAVSPIIELTPGLRSAITHVYDLAERCLDSLDTTDEDEAFLAIVKPLTTYRDQE